jgi:hypothetical protein
MTSHTIQGLASLGRHGDSMLVHMSPHEVAGLNYLAKKQGTKLTINPHTGLPEAFSLGGFFSSLLPMFVGAAVPGSWGAMAPLLAGAATGGALAAAKGENPLMGGLMGGLGGYGGGNLATSLGAAAAPAGGWVPGQAISQSVLPNAAGMADAGAASTVGGAGNIGMANAFNTISGSGAAGSAISGSGNIIDPALNRFTQAGTGLKNIATGQPGAWDAFKAAGGSGMKLAMPIGGALLGGLEPSDIYGNPINMDEAKKKEAYDPTRSLNLSGDTGLRLVAKGGYIDGYAMGGTVTTGGLRDLYSATDNLTNPALSRDGYGVGRLDSLARAQSMDQAQTTGYAMGGPVSFADGGPTDPLTGEIQPIDQTAGITSLTPQPATSQTMPTQQVQNTATALSGAADATSGGSIISQVTANLKADPNYQGKNPIEAAIVKQIKGSDPMQQGQPSQQGLGAIAPSQPMAPSFNPSQAMTPTYYAGMNAPKGYAEGGETHMNLDTLPSLNLNTGSSAPGIAAIISSNNDRSRGPFNNAGINFASGNQGNRNTSGPFNNAGINFASDNRDGLSFRPLGGFAHGGYLDGQGDGMSDSIPATIEGKQPARLADGEFVVPADVVSHIGNGSSKAGSQRLYSMLDKIRKARTGHAKQGKQINPSKYMPA